MNNILAVNTLSYHGHSLDRALKGVADCGINYIELTAVPGWSEHAVPEEMSSEDVKSLRSKIQGFGLSVLSVSGHLDMAEPGIIDNFKVRIDFTGDLGAKYIITSPGNKRHLDQFLKNMEILGPYAEEKGVVICLETEDSIVYDADSVIELMKAIQSPAIKINYDGANLIFFSNRTLNPHEDIARILPYIVYMHIKDVQYENDIWTFPEIGQGLMDYDKFFTVLKNNNYTGPLSIELELTDKKEGDGEFGHFLPTLPAEQIDQILKRSISFIREKMK